MTAHFWSLNLIQLSVAPYQGVKDCYRKGRCSRELSYIYVFLPVHRQLISRGLYRVLRPGDGATHASSWGSWPDMKSLVVNVLSPKRKRDSLQVQFNSGKFCCIFINFWALLDLYCNYFRVSPSLSTIMALLGGHSSPTTPATPPLQLARSWWYEETSIFVWEVEKLISV